MDRISIVLARRYARAYLSLFYDTLPTDAHKVFTQSAQLFTQKPNLGFLLDLSIVSRETKLQELDVVVQECGLPASAKKIIALAIDHKRGSLLGEIFYQIAQLYKQQAHVDVCTVTSSSALSSDQKKDIERTFAQKTGIQYSFVYAIDPSLIAGIRCQSTHEVWEDSVDQKLRRLENSLKR